MRHIRNMPEEPPSKDACQGPRVRAVPPGDDRERLLCPDCGYVAYQNPLIVVGSVVTWRESGEDEDRILMCRRAIEPRKGYWTLPAGFMEEHETTQAGAMREAWEEARAKIEIDALLAIYDIPRISQVQLIFRARLTSPDVSAGPESLEVALFHWDEIPWADLAFPTVHWALREHRARLGQTGFAPAINPAPDVAAQWERML